MDSDEELQVIYDNWCRRLTQRLYGDLLFLGLAIVTAYFVGIGYLVWFVVREVKEEINFRARYGSNWSVEFEKYHGSVTHANARIAVAIGALIAIAAISVWFFRQLASRKPKHIHHG